MTRKFFFHSSISQVKTIVVYSLCLMIFLCWFIPHVFESPLLLYRPQLLRFSAYFTLTMLAGIYLIQVLFFQFKHTVYIVTESQLIKRNPVKIKTINLADITEFRHLNYLGVGIVKTRTQTLFLSLIIENLGELIESIEGCLETEHRLFSYNKKEIDTFKFYGRIAAFHLNHSLTIILPLFYIIIFSLFISSLTAFFIWTLPLPAALIWTLCGIIFPGIGFLIATAIILRNVSRQIKKCDAVKPDYDTASVYTYTALITAAAYCITGIMFKNIFGF